MITLELTPAEARALFEILNLSGVALTEIDTDYGSDSIESICQKDLDRDGAEINVNRAAHRMFNYLKSIERELA